MPVSVVSTTDTSHKSGVPNPTFRRPTASKSVILSARRRSRYNRAEQSLVFRSMQISSEPSPEELKIRILQEAVANLSTYARESQESVVQLRKRLVDRSMEPESYQLLQKERWREERRQVVLEQKAKVAREKLACLSSGDISEQPKPDRRTANLISFFDRSMTKTSLQFKTPPSFELKKITELSPLSLRPRPTPTRIPIAPLNIKAFPQPREPLYARRNQPQKSIITKIDEDKPRTISQAISLATTETGFTSTLSPSTSNDDDASEGFAYIYSPTSRRCKADVMAELDDIPIPDYAVHLLRDFEHPRDGISLSDILPLTSANPHITPKHSTSRSLIYGKLFTRSARTPINSAQDDGPPSPHSPFPRSKHSLDHNDKRHAPTFSLGSFFVKGQVNKRADDSIPCRHSLNVLPTVAEEDPQPVRLPIKHTSINATKLNVISPMPPERATGDRGRGPTLVSRMTKSFYQGRN
jgi:hypothetical protein